MGRYLGLIEYLLTQSVAMAIVGGVGYALGRKLPPVWRTSLAGAAMLIIAVPAVRDDWPTYPATGAFYLLLAGALPLGLYSFLAFRAARKRIMAKS